MTADIIQAQYEQLETIAARFGHEAERNTALAQQVAQAVQALQNGGWAGQGSAAFFAEMEATTNPALHRLIMALEEARHVTLTVKEVIRTAEEEAAQVFNKDGEYIANKNLTDNIGSSAAGPNSSGPFTIGLSKTPNIKHDNGFLEKFAKREPTVGDRLNLLKWRGVLEASEGLRPDLADANAAYRHFLEGNGADRTINYERFLLDDVSGKTAIGNLLHDAQSHAEIIGQGREKFSMTSNPYAIGGYDARFPYPETENWQKTLGSHTVWTSSDVQISGTPPNRVYTMKVTLHMEDRYNFNPGQADIATGIPDSDNGVFEITGLAHQYMNYGEVSRVLTWQEGNMASVQITDLDSSRNRRPSDNRLLRNQI